MPPGRLGSFIGSWIPSELPDRLGSIRTSWPPGLCQGFLAAWTRIMHRGSSWASWAAPRPGCLGSVRASWPPGLLESFLDSFKAFWPLGFHHLGFMGCSRTSWAVPGILLTAAWTL